MRTPRLGLLAVVALMGCRQRWEHKSDVATSSSGRWQRAFSTVEFSPAFNKNGTDFPDSLAHTVTIERDSDFNSLHVILGQWSKTDYPQDFARLGAMKDTLRFAPDGHAFSLSSDGGKSYYVFDLTPATGPVTEPFYCTHRRFESLDPWPDTREVVLEVLDETSGNASTHVHAEPTPRTDAVKPNDGELLDASLYACTMEATDPRMQKALLDAYVAPWGKWIEGRGGDNSTLQKCVTALAVREPSVLARLKAAAAALPSDPRGDRLRVEGALYFVEHPSRY